MIVVVLGLGVASILGSPLLSEVQEREDAHRAFLDHFPGVAFRVVPRGQGEQAFYDLLEGRVEELTGWPAERFLRDPSKWTDLMDGPGLAAFEEMNWRYEEGVIVSSVREYPIRRKDGSQAWVRTVARTVREGTAGLPVVYGLHYDVTEQHRSQEALRARENERETLLRNLPGSVIHILDRDFRYLFSGGDVLGSLGLSDEELRGKRTEDVLPPELADVVIPQYRKVLAGETVQYEGEFGGIVFLVTAAPLSDAGGAVDRILVLSLDVTGRKRQEQALQESQERLALVLRAGRHGIYDLDLRTGAATVNDTYATMLGLDPTTFAETNAAWRDRLHPDDRASVYRVFEEYVSGVRDDYVVEFRQRTAAGGWVWILSVGAVVEWDDAGGAVRMVGTHTDITEIKSLQAELARQNAFLETILDCSPILYCVFDAAGGLQYANPAFQAFYGWSLEEAQALPDFLGCVYPDPGERSRVTASIRRGGGAWGHFRARLRDGTYRETLYANVVLPDGASIGIGQDVTERVEAEARQQAHLDELRRWHDVMLGREERVQELKREVNELCRQAGQSSRYAEGEEAAP